MFARRHLPALASLAALLFSLLPAEPAGALPVTAPLSSYTSADWTSSQWALDAIRAKDAWPVTRGEGAVVAVIDTGVDSGHPDLAGQILDGYVYQKNPDTSVWSAVPVKAAEMNDWEGHGTHVAGIIAAADNGFGVTGIAPQAKILPINVADALNSDDRDQVFWVLRDAIIRAVADGADVINMSLGMPAVETAPGFENNPNMIDLIVGQAELCKTVRVARRAGVVVVVSAGNERLDGDPASLPAGCEDALSVAATNTQHQASYFSSFDSTVDLAAPGGSVFSTISRAVNPVLPYQHMSGTSMAAPVVAGVAALAVAAHPDLSVEQIMALLTSTTTDLGIPGPDPIYGSGLVDAAAVVGALPARSTPPVAVPTLLFDVRAAMNDNPTQFTVVWLPPAAATLPTGYTVTLFDRFGAQTETRDLPGTAVRATFTVANRSSFWTLLTAHYPGGDQTAPPRWTPLLPTGPTGVTISSAIAEDGRPAYTVRWDPLTVLDADRILITASGTGFEGQRSVFNAHTLAVQPDLTGEFPTSALYELDEEHWDLQRMPEFDLIFTVQTQQDNDAEEDMSEPVTVLLPGTRDAVLTNALIDQTRAVAEVQVNRHVLSCPAGVADMDCPAVRATLTFKATDRTKIRVKGKTRWVTSARIVVRTVLITRSPIDDYGNSIWAIRASGPKVLTGTTKVTMTATVGEKRILGSTTVYSSSPAPMPSA